jgi:hypothetical protein
VGNGRTKGLQMVAIGRGAAVGFLIGRLFHSVGREMPIPAVRRP